jgi:hypothetical protein
MTLDPIDLQLIDAVQQNAAQRLEDLGRLVQLAPPRDRLRRLERDGVIRRWTVALDAAALGLGVLAYVGCAQPDLCLDAEELGSSGDREMHLGGGRALFCPGAGGGHQRCWTD